MEITADQLAFEYDLEVIGDGQRKIGHVCELGDLDEVSLVWTNDAESIPKRRKGTILVSYKPVALDDEVTYLICKNDVKYYFARIVNDHFGNELNLKNNVEVLQSKGMCVGTNCFISEGAHVDLSATIEHNVVIQSGVTVGKNCHIQSGAVLGSSGLGYIKLPSGVWYPFPQIGKVIIEDDVSIGANAVIRRAALSETVVGRGTKLGSLVNIGHNCKIGKNCMIITSAILAGSVIVEDDVYISMNATIRNKVRLKKGCLIGMGAVVTKDVQAGITVLGNPAKPLL